jgi:hypothetical protein
MILLLVVIDAHEEAAVLYAPVWFSVLTHNEFAIFAGRSKSHQPLPPSLCRTSEKANDEVSQRSSTCARGQAEVSALESERSGMTKKRLFLPVPVRETWRPSPDCDAMRLTVRQAKF